MTEAPKLLSTMPLQLKVTRVEDLPRVQAFLREIFGFGHDHPTLDGAHMEWKYFTPRGDWEGPRSYILEESERIVAHLASVPGRIRAGDTDLRCLHFIDWAGAPGSMLSGSSLLRKVARGFDVVCCIGGSPENRRALPQLGFKPVAETELYARPVRPWRQVRTHQLRNWKLPARLARNFWLSRRGVAADNKWVALPAHPGDVPAEVWRAAETGCVMRVRTASIYEYYLQSPQTQFRFSLLEHDGEPKGAVCWCHTPGQARIADIWLTDGLSPAGAAAQALAAAERAVRERSDVAEIVLRASTPRLAAAARRCGYSLVASTPLMAWPVHPAFQAPVDSPLIIDDAAYLHTGKPVYET